MARRTPIFTALDPSMLASGLAPDQQKTRTPLWITGDAVEFVNGRVRNRREDRKLLQAEVGPVRGIAQQRLSNGELVLWFVQNGTLYRWDQFSLNPVRTYDTGNLGKPYFNMVPYGDWLLINRGYNKIDWWNGASFATFPEMPTNTAYLLKHLSFLLALGTGSKQTGVSWCDANNISKWVPAANNSAGSLFIEEFDGGIIAGASLGPVIAVYGENEMALVSFIGSPFYFGYKIAQTGIGAVGPEAVASVGSVNYGVSRRGFWVTDGQTSEYIDKGRLHEYFQNNINWTAAHKIIAARNDISRTVEFHIPTGTSFELNEAWSFDPATVGWSKIAPNSFFSQELAFGAPVKASTTGELARLGAANYTKNNLLLQTKPMLMQLQTSTGLTDVHFDVQVDEIELLLHECRNCQLRIGSSTSAAGTIRWSTPIQLEIGKSSYNVPAGVPSGTYWHLEFTAQPELETVYAAADTVLEASELVTAVDPLNTWQFNLQGFMLFGNIEGAKNVH